AQTGGLDGLGHIGGLHRAEQAALSTGLDGELDLVGLERVLERHSLFVVVDRAGLAGGADRRHLLLATTGPGHSEALGDEVVAGVPVLDLDDVAGASEPGNLVRENQLCHCRYPLAASAGVRQERHFARVLDRLGDQTLLLHRDTGDTTGADLSALRDELAKRCDVLVVNDAHADRLRGSGGLATLPRLAAVAARLSSHGFSLRDEIGCQWHPEL